MSRVGSMILSTGQAHNVEEAEGRGHKLEQVSATTFHCEGCEMTSRIGDGNVAQPFDAPCGGLFSAGDEAEGVLAF